MEISKQFAFEAAHFLPRHRGKCHEMHGHSYRLDVVVIGLLIQAGPSEGMVIDFDDLSRIVNGRIIARLDHVVLNDLIKNPTVEHICEWIWSQLKPLLPSLAEITVWETATARATLRIQHS